MEEYGVIEEGREKKEGEEVGQGMAKSSAMFGCSSNKIMPFHFPPSIQPARAIEALPCQYIPH
jgi:hypothetical protein